MKLADYLAQLHDLRTLPPSGLFLGLGNLLALKHRPEVGFYHRNLERGALLYALVSHFRPRKVLEFGTGRGYSAACMAQAMLDVNLDGGIWTIDIVAYDEPQAWAIDGGNGGEIKRLSLQDVWEKHLPAELRSKVHLVHGDSSAALTRPSLRKELAPVQIVYIDGGHSYETCRHDFVMALSLAASPVIVVFDDYGLPGVKRLIEEDLRDKPCELRILRTLNQIPELQRGRMPSEQDPGMVVLSVTNPGALLQAFGGLSRFLISYRFGTRIKGTLRRLLK